MGRNHNGTFKVEMFENLVDFKIYSLEEIEEELTI